jgi:hypothetical protein
MADWRRVRTRIHPKEKQGSLRTMFARLPVRHLTALVAALTLALVAAAPARSDVILDWNEKADAIVGAKGLPPPMQGRTLAILHVSIFEAVNAIDHRYAPYGVQLATDRDTSKEAAAASAAYEALLALYPDLRGELDATLARTLAGIPAGAPRDKGIALGKKAAAGVLALRAKDGSDAPESYRPYAKPGVYVPTTMPVSLTIGGMKPWVMRTRSQFRPAAPPALDSATWTRDLNEIREIGGLHSTRRSAEQTDVGKFWFLAGARSYDPLVRQVAQQKTKDIVECARLFALVSLAAADSFIAIFDAKYTYNFWRPITAIRNADQTGNTATPRDATWLPLGETPMHPEYPCAHCISSSAVATTLQALVGDSIAAATMTSGSAPGVTRKWTRLQDYNMEVSNARIWAGFHYRFSTEVGREMGKKIAELTVATQLQPLARPSAADTH